ncbi:hypothetical protein VST7929_02849 [Vibrio stylophorae]|uniref:Uncharacterized protein n=1 Tax=Vibrio stylophorae TaxID=659351 RepID=A0ABM8ZX22_9VIBR|nr:hypothetical protein VST7929_02849 [Vibrio stylophorae]
MGYNLKSGVIYFIGQNKIDNKDSRCVREIKDTRTEDILQCRNIIS